MRSQILKMEGIFKSVFPLTSTRYPFQSTQSRVTHLPWSFPRSYKTSCISSVSDKPATITRFFDVINRHKKIADLSSIFDIISNETVLKKLLKDINSYTEGNYLQDHFIHWLSTYANHSRNFL